MNLSVMTKDKKVLEILNDHWKSQTLRPNIGQEFIPANQLLDVYDHGDRLRVSVKLEDSKIRLMMIDKELFDSSVYQA